MTRVRTGVLKRVFLVLPVLCLASFTWSGLGPQTPGFETAAERAERLRETGRLAEAVAAYRMAVSLKPDWAEGLWYLGTLLYDQDRPAEAAGAFARLVEISPSDGRARAFLGLCRFQTGEFEDALEDLTFALGTGLGGMSNLVPVVRFHTAMLLTRAGRFEEAFEAFRPFAASAPTSDDVLLALGLCILRDRILPAEIPSERISLTRMAGRAGASSAKGAWNEAEETFRSLTTAYPNEPDLHFSWGRTRLHRMKTDPSAPDPLPLFEQELERSPGHPAVLLEAASLQASRGQAALARSNALAAAEKAANSPRELVSIAEILIAVEALSDAEALLREAVALAPGELEYLGRLSQLYLKTGRPEAIAALFSDFTRIEEEGFPIRRASKVFSADQVEIDDDELVIGVTINGDVRAYPVKFMNGPSNELVNDTVGKEPVAATW